MTPLCLTVHARAGRTRHHPLSCTRGFTPLGLDTRSPTKPLARGHLAGTSKGQNAMKIDTYDSQNLDDLKDDILRRIHAGGCKERIPDICTVLRNVQDALSLEDNILRLIHAVDGYEERTAEICTVLRNVLDTLAPCWFEDELHKLEEIEWANGQYELYHDADIEREKNEACEKRFAEMLLDEKTARTVSDEDISRLLDNPSRQGPAAAWLDAKARAKRRPELAILYKESERRGMPRWRSFL